MAEANFNLKIISNNVRGLNDIKKRTKYFHWLRKNNVDISCIQETFCTKTFEKTFNHSWEGEIYHCFSDSSHSRGLCIILRQHLQLKIHSIHKQYNGRIILINFDVSNGNIITVCNVYAPNNETERTEFYQNLLTFINTHKHNESELILCGDMNVNLDMIKVNSKHITGSEEKLQRILYTLDLEDCAYTDSQNTDSTYVKPGNAKIQSRIDYVFMSKALNLYLKSYKLKIPPVPDHKAVETVIEKILHKRGQLIWKLNTSLLKDTRYNEEITRIIQTTMDKQNTGLSKGELWDWCKIKIKEFSINFGKTIAQRKKNIKCCIEKEINEIDEIIKTNTDNDVHLLVEKRNRLKSDLDILLANDAIGYQIRSKAEWVEKGEKNTAYFLNLEKYRQSKNAIFKLTKSDGKQVDSKENILIEIVNYYQQLYSSKNVPTVVINSYFESLDSVNIRKLNNFESNSCEGGITANECDRVLSKFKENKSPGSDGLPIEFYKQFWHLLKDHMISIFNEAFDNEKLSDSQNQGILTLLHKKGDPQLLKNYRPISLLNTDYKILMHVLANRMHTVLHKIISEDQNGYVKKRFIGYNIRLIEDIIYYQNKQSSDSYLAFIDFEKAYDTLEWKFLFKTLKFYNFGPTFIKWIRTTYKSPSISIKNNGWLSESFEMKRGVRQGCPISSLLFILTAEILAHKLRLNANITGINIGQFCDNNSNRVVKLRQYADDMILLGTNEISLKHSFKEISKFTAVAGPKLNMDKTEILVTGEYQNVATFCDKKVAKSVNCLGIEVGHDLELCEKINWANKIEKIQRLLIQWKKRHLTIFGKIIVIKTLALSQIIYSATNTHIPDYVIPRLNTIVYNFWWENKERIKRKTLIGKFEDGGVEMIDINSYFIAIKVTWIKRLMNSESNWSVIGNHSINQFGGRNLLLRITTSDINYINNLPVFYKQIFQACISTNKLEHRNIKSEYILLRQPIWHNIHIQYKRKTLYFKKLIEKNIIFIKDLKFVKGILDETYIYSIMGNKNCWMEVFQLKNALLKYKEKLLNFSESILSTRAPPLFITKKYTKEIYNIHVASVL